MHAIDANRAIANLAARQKGLVQREQLLEQGLGRGAIDHRIRTARLFVVRPRVYALTPTVSADAQLLAAAWCFGPGAVISDRSAAALWDLLRPAGRTIHVTVPPGPGIPKRRGITTHRRDLPDRLVTSRRGLPVTSLVRTLLDLAVAAPLPLLERAFDQAQVEHHLAPADLEVEAILRAGHRGSRNIRRLLADAIDPGLVESRLELLFLRFCTQQGLPRPATQVPIGPWRADFVFAEAGVVVETDGARFHGTALRRRRDATKTADLEALGYLVLRLRWADIVDRPEHTAASLRHTLEHARLARSA